MIVKNVWKTCKFTSVIKAWSVVYTYKQAQAFWKTYTPEHYITFCLAFKSSPAQVGDEKTWKSPQRCNFFLQNRLYLDLMSTTTTELNNLVINNYVWIKDRWI